MPAPYPVEAVAKGVSNSQKAKNIYAHYAWLARWSNEIGADPDLDLKKLAQLAFIHCRNFAALTDAATPELLRAVRQRFSEEGLEWAVLAAMSMDLTAIRNESLALFAFVRDNVPEARSAANVAVKFAPDSDTGTGEETAVKLPKPHPAVAEVAKLRALFA